MALPGRAVAGSTRSAAVDKKHLALHHWGRAPVRHRELGRNRDYPTVDHVAVVAMAPKTSFGDATLRKVVIRFARRAGRDALRRAALAAAVALAVGDAQAHDFWI